MIKTSVLIILLSFGLKTTFSQKMSFEIQGHRGCRGLMPENTIPAFKKAIDLDVNTLELDVVISKDKKVVVSHDPFFNPDCTLNPKGQPISEAEKGNLYLMDYAAIRKYNVGAGNKKFPEQKKIATDKPLLEKMIQTIEKYAKNQKKTAPKYNIEIKSLASEYNKSQPEVSIFSDLVYEVIKNIPAERITLQSFDYNVLKYWHAAMASGKYKKIALSILIEPTDNNDIGENIKSLGFKPDIWSPFYQQLNDSRVKELHTEGIKVIPWTVNERGTMEKIKNMGCDGLITDYPDRAMDLKN